MAAMRLGFPEIERQLRSVRRRRNLVTVQQVLYLWGGLGALAGALLVLAALRVEAQAFDLAFWAAVAALGLGLAGAIHHLWRRWLSLGTAIHWTDRNGGLEDRLATLVAHRSCPQPTRLASLVVNQLFTLRHRWQPKVLVPRQVPRTVYFFLASLLALLATAFIERPPAEPQVFRVARIGQTAPGDSPATARGSSADGAHPGNAAAGTRREATVDREAPGQPHAAGPLRGASPPGTDGGWVAHRGEGFSAGEVARGDRATDGFVDGDRRSAEGSVQEGVSRRVQEMIRRALGTKPESRQARLGLAPGAPGGEQTAARKRAERQRLRTAAEEEAARSSSGAAEAFGGRPRRERSERQASSRKEGEAEGTLPGGQHASGGAGGRRTSGGLFSSDAPRAQAREALKTFQLNLSVLAQAARSTMEPQGPWAGVLPETGSVAPLPSEPRLSGRDQADDRLLRTEVPPEHEGIVRRIFSHPE